MKNTPLQQYQHDLQAPGFVEDSVQLKAIKTLERIFKAVLHNQGILLKLKKMLGREKSIKGLYMWGEVGSGKTYLMDTFYNALPKELKRRSHFHQFMRHVHQRLTELQGRREPLYRIAKDFVQDAQVLCLDEFFIDDIGDAMILGKLLQHLFSLGVVLVTTSNIPVDDLYKDGLQRQRFLPTIALLKKYCQILEVNNQVDYRLQDVTSEGVYFTPLDEHANNSVQKCFNYFSHQRDSQGNIINLNNRELKALRCAKGVLWVDFHELCQQSRHANDYLELAKQFHTIILSNVPIMQSKDNNAAKRFIHAIDVFYDEKVRLIISAADKPEQLYQGQLLADKFQRTISRLHEMQGKEYLEKSVARRYSDLD